MAQPVERTATAKPDAASARPFDERNAFSIITPLPMVRARKSTVKRPCPRRCPSSAPLGLREAARDREFAGQLAPGALRYGGPIDLPPLNRSTWHVRKKPAGPRGGALEGGNRADCLCTPPGGPNDFYRLSVRQGKIAPEKACTAGPDTRRVFSNVPMGWASRSAASRGGFVILARAV